MLTNQYGTAPGMWLKKENTVFVSMPGVPFEMKELMNNQVIPKLQKEYERPFIIHKTLMTYGVGESDLATAIEEVENALPEHTKLAYLPNLGKVRLRLTAKGPNETELEESLVKEISKIEDILGDVVVGYEGEKSIELAVGELLIQAKKTLAIAESCTGGKIAETITSNSGVSAFFKGGAVTYATQSKIDLLGVEEKVITENGVTSHEVAEAMASAAKIKFKSDYAIATTGQCRSDQRRWRCRSRNGFHRNSNSNQSIFTQVSI